MITQLRFGAAGLKSPNPSHRALQKRSHCHQATAMNGSNSSLCASMKSTQRSRIFTWKREVPSPNRNESKKRDIRNIIVQFASTNVRPGYVTQLIPQQLVGKPQLGLTALWIRSKYGRTARFARPLAADVLTATLLRTTSLGLSGFLASKLRAAKTKNEAFSPNPGNRTMHKTHGGALSV